MMDRWYGNRGRGRDDVDVVVQHQSQRVVIDALSALRRLATTLFPLGASAWRGSSFSRRGSVWYSCWVSVRITNNRETAEELTIDVFYDVWRRASAYEPAGGSVVGWIMNQARSRAIDRVRFDNRKKRVHSELEHPLMTTAANDPQQAWHVKEQSQVLHEALEVLTPGERQVIESAFFSELTYLEVAAKLKQPLGTVKTRIRSGLGKLREKLTARGKGI